ncbi:hypothetical protein Q4610_01655 [Sphingobium sp. HBC34]|uniref:Uncharacterized protein n=1 Tax=Sphingobium cyanobacteriorum TaxID=3063954 RepID=A0ABT8ZIX9_9SPHN|nr:hypothetical protein [Sphingobium sp. HBC34]MDO7833740.1 hypothetical protein [Sphingobium sp. HBC34]
MPGTGFTVSGFPARIKGASAGWTRTRALAAGTIIGSGIGSGIVSNADYATVGSACISEQRAIETIRRGAPKTPFMHFGDRVQIATESPDRALFGTIDLRVIRAGQA